MSLLAQPLVTSEDIVTVQPVSLQDDVRGAYYGQAWRPSGRPFPVISVKLDSAEIFIEGKQSSTVAYTLYAELPRGATPPVTEKGRVWHPEACPRKADGTPDYAQSMDIRSVVPRKRDRLVQIDVQRTY